MDHSTLTVAGTNDTNMSFITRGLWEVCHRCFPFRCLWLVVVDRGGGAPLSHLVPMFMPRGTLPRGGLGCAFRQCSFPHWVACDTDAWTWVGLAFVVDSAIARECLSLAATHFFPHAFGYVDWALFPLLLRFTAPDPIV